MAVFSFKAYDSRGQRYHSKLEAPSLFEAKRSLIEQGIQLLHIEQNKPSSPSKVSSSQVLQFTRELSQLIEAGLPLFESINLLKDQFAKESISDVLYSLSETLESGSSFSKALSKFPQCFPPLYCSLIRVGEESGHLDRALKKIIIDDSKRIQLKKKVQSALIYPSILLFFSTVLIHLMILYIVPSLENLFDADSGHFFTRTVIAFSHHMRRWEPLYLLLTVPSVLLMTWKLKSPKLRPHLDRFILKVPLVKSFLLDLSLSKFSSTMSMLLNGGIPLIDSLLLTRTLIQNSVIQKALDEVIQKIKEGQKLSVEFERQGLFPPLFSRLVHLGEKSGELGNSFEKLAQIYEEEVDKKLSKLMALLSPLILLIMGVIIGAVMLGILIPMTDINSISI